MHVVHVSCFVDSAGRPPATLLEEWTTLSAVAEAAVGDGVTVSVVQAATRDETIELGGLSYHFVRECRWGVSRRGVVRRSRRVPRRIAEHLRALRPDVLHCHGLGFARQAMWLRAAFPDAGCLVQDHADRPRRGRPHPAARLAGARLGVAFTSRDLATPFVEGGWLDPEVPVFEILESSSSFAPGDRAAARRRAGLTGDPCFVWVGRLTAIKDPVTVLQAFSRAAAHMPDPRLHFYYDDAPLFGEVSQRVANDPVLAARVHFHGGIPHAEVEFVLRAADVFVLGSRSEGSGYAALEALACGTPPLVTDIPAFRAITGGGRVGALVPPGDAQAMTDAMVRLADASTAGGRDDVRRHFDRHCSFEVIGGRLRTAYRALSPAT